MKSKSRTRKPLFAQTAAVAATAVLSTPHSLPANEPPPVNEPPQVLLCYATGTPHEGREVAIEEADTVTLPTPVDVNGRVIADSVADALRARGIEVRVVNVAEEQPRLAELGGADAVAFVAPVYFGATHWAIKKLIDDRNGALYYARGSATPIRRALCLLLVEDVRKVGRAAGDFNSAGSPFPRDANRLDAIIRVTDRDAALSSAKDAAARLASLLGRGENP